MSKLIKLIFLILIPLVVVGKLIYDVQNMPGYNNLPELKKKYSNREKTVVDHSKFDALKVDFKNAHEITAACLSCHEQRGHEMLKSFHFTWEKEEYIEGRGVVYLGKKNALNNFCTGIAGSEQTCNRCHAGYGYGQKEYDFTNPNNIDCMVCHDNSFTYEKAKGRAGYPVDSIDYKKVFANISSPKNQNCGSCHFNSAGGNNVKHGDLETALLVSNRDVDVHMGIDGVNLQCSDCHITEKHVMKGRYYGLSSTNNRRALCEDCHTAFPHKKDIINEHSVKVSCKTCHIPTYAKVNATKMSWDWSTATEKQKNGEGVSIYDEQGNQIYLTDKGNFTWSKNVVPEYFWFNGTANHHLLTDSITEVPVKINTLYGSYADRNSKIVPVKVHRGSQPYDTESRRIVQAKLWDPEKGKGALWVDYNWNAALKAGMAYLDLPYSGKYDFVKTEMFLPVSHMVSPAENALECKDCHTHDNSRLAAVGGFYMPGRDRNNLIDTMGKVLIIISFLAIAAHAIARNVSRKKRFSQTFNN